MKQILLVTESPTLREYLMKKLSSYGLKVLVGISCLDGMLKLRNSTTALDLVILDYCFSRMSGMEFLDEKQRNLNTSDVPVIIISSTIEKAEIVALSKKNVKKVCSKPIKIDSILAAVSEILHVNLSIDAAKCVIDTHVNEDIIFIEVAYGLNQEKIELLGYKLKELAELYELRFPKALIIMSNIELTREDEMKLREFLSVITHKARINPKAIEMLTTSTFVASFIAQNEEFSKIEVVESLEKAMDALTGMKVSDWLIEGKTIVTQDFLVAKEAVNNGTFHLKFQQEGDLPDTPSRDFVIGIVDDDMVAQSIVSNSLSSGLYKTKVYDNGRLFLDDIEHTSFDLVFLDLMMPEVDGFGVLKALEEKKLTIPIIILSALSRRETVVQALTYGVHSYIIKPVKPAEILRKAAEILRLDF